MKKFYSFVLLLASCLVVNAQFTATTYRGAFAPAPIAQWTDGWANFDPQNAVYPLPTVSNVVVITANITANTTWTNTNVYYVKEQIYVKNNAVLTVQAGTTVLFEKVPPPSGGVVAAPRGLVVTRGSQLIANGTATQPIVFTSDQTPGNRNRGDWGGIILLGNGSVNINNGVNAIEGIASGPDTQYGGGTTPNDNDSSGSLRYVRIEFGGYVFAQNQEINGLTMGGVGRGTTISFVQCSFINDDSFEWFGGAVNCSNLISYRGTDDDFDTAEGYSGKVQFCLSVRDPRISDISSSNGFESDNNGAGSAGTPFTTTVFSNVTIVGPHFRATLPNNGSPSLAQFGRAAHLRRNTKQSIFNSIFMDYNNGLHIENFSTETNASNNEIRFQNNILAATVAGRDAYESADSSTNPNNPNFNTATWYALAANANTTVASSSALLTKAYEATDALTYTGLDYRPTATSIAATGASFADPFLLSNESFVNKNFKSSVYPNPFASNFKIGFDTISEENVTVSTFDITGRQIEMQKVNANAVQSLELGSNYKTGVYLVVLKQAESTQSFKVVKK